MPDQRTTDSGAGEAKRILIVEDDVAVAQSIADVLESEGFRAVTAANGLEAIGALDRGERPALILLDMMMPVMDGWEFRREQQRRGELAHIPVIVLTADSGARQKASAVKAHGHLQVSPIVIARSAPS